MAAAALVASRRGGHEGKKGLRPPTGRKADLSLLFPYHHNRTVSVTNDRVGNAAHNRTSYPATSSATHHYQPSPYLLGELNDLSIRPSHTEMSPHYGASGSFDLLHLGIQ